MTDRLIYRERIPSTDPRLRRHILHDSESRRYVYDTTGLTVASVEHQRTLPILDQGQVGSCTAEAAFGCLGTDPYYSTDLVGLVTSAFGSFDQAGAYHLYSAEETIDGDGPYPPQDNGSTGLTSAKALRAAGLISGWTQTFTLTDALKALTQTAFVTGTNWYNSMFTPDGGGLVTVDQSSGVAGGHEYEVVGYDQATQLVKFANSWGESWGQGGYFYMHAQDWGTLLGQQGDVTIYTPITQPAPTPTPVPPAPPGPTPDPGPSDADRALAVVARHFVAEHHITHDARMMARALHEWLIATGQAANVHLS